MSYTDDVKIDKYLLEEEWENQPALYEKWSMLYAEAVDEKNTMNRKLDVHRAQVEFDIRQNPKKYGFNNKPTVGEVNAMVSIDEEVQKLTRILNKKTKQVNILNGVKEALNHKKSALENLVKLFLAGYYTKPDVPKQYREKIEEDLRMKSNENIKDKLSKKMRKK